MAWEDGREGWRVKGRGIRERESRGRRGCGQQDRGRRREGGQGVVSSSLRREDEQREEKDDGVMLKQKQVSHSPNPYGLSDEVS